MINFRFAMVLVSLAVSGCCVLNDKKEGNLEFERQMNALVGKPIGDAYHGFTLAGYKKLSGLVYNVVDYNGQKVYQRINQFPMTDSCSADFYVNVDTGLIAGWYYYPGANKELCVRYKHSC